MNYRCLLSPNLSLRRLLLVLANKLLPPTTQLSLGEMSNANGNAHTHTTRPQYNSCTLGYPPPPFFMLLILFASKEVAYFFLLLFLLLSCFLFSLVAFTSTIFPLCSPSFDVFHLSSNPLKRYSAWLVTLNR